MKTYPPTLRLPDGTLRALDARETLAYQAVRLLSDACHAQHDSTRRHSPKALRLAGEADEAKCELTRLVGADERERLLEWAWQHFARIDGPRADRPMESLTVVPGGDDAATLAATSSGRAVPLPVAAPLPGSVVLGRLETRQHGKGDTAQSSRYTTGANRPTSHRSPGAPSAGGPVSTSAPDANPPAPGSGETEGEQRASGSGPHTRKSEGGAEPGRRFSASHVGNPEPRPAA